MSILFNILKLIKEKLSIHIIILMSLSNYENYYHYCVANNMQTPELEDECNDITKFQCDTSDNNKVINYSPVIGLYLHVAIRNEEIYDAISYKAVEDINNEMLNNMNILIKKLISDKYNFGCPFELHRAYLYENKEVKYGETDELNYDTYHWKNEPKTIITVYINLDSSNNTTPFISALYHPKYDKYITMKTNRTGLDQWGCKTHLRYKDCKLHDGQVEEFKRMGFIEKPIRGPIVILGNNVIHKNILKDNHKIMVLKYRPTEIESTDSKLDIGNIFDTDIDPCPY